MTGDTATSIVRLSDGRALEVLTGGDPAGRTLVFHNGTPTAPVPSAWFDELLRDAGLRLVTWARPGYAGSDRQPGRSVADVVPDTVAVLDHLRLDSFVTLGWSGGGPHAIACAALLPQRCLKAATLGGVAPWEAPNLDWLAGMGPENVEELSLAARGDDAVRPFLENLAAELRDITGETLAAALGGLVPDVDKACLSGDYADWMAATFRYAFSTGIDGAVDDDLAFTKSWGVDLAAITVPVAIWQGDEDLMVPFSHGRWLVENVAGAQGHLLPGEGHLSITVGHLQEALRDLLQMPGERRRRS